MLIPKNVSIEELNEIIVEPDFRPGPSDFDNPYMGYFQKFLFNTVEERQRLSNAIDFWDSIPRYSVTRRQQNLLRDEKTGTLPKHVLTFCYKGETFRVEISPAKLDVINDGGIIVMNGNSIRTIDYYPANREELVDEALRKIASRNSYGFIKDLKPHEISGVVFTLYELMAELSDTGHEFSYRQLIESLTILNSSQIKIYKEDAKKNDTGLISSSYLPVLAAVTRSKYIADPSSKWLVHFHPLVTQGIAMLAYRQMNYKTLMGLSTQLCRWLHKYLCIKFINAGIATPPFEIHYKTIKRDSGLLTRKVERQNFMDIENALDELKEKGILRLWTKSDILAIRNKKIDTIYKLSPSMRFITETKAANKRKGDTVEILAKKINR